MINSLLFKESALLSRSFFIYLHSFFNSFSSFYFSLFSVLIIQEMNQQYSSQCCLLLINRAWALITISLYLINCWDLSFISNSILNYYQLKELGKVCWIFALSRRLKFCILEAKLKVFCLVTNRALNLSFWSCFLKNWLDHAADQKERLKQF